MTQIAVFPIPNCVAFPGTVFPLHVFEPRYRKMVRFCLDTGTPMAVCHVEKLLRPARSDQAPEEALNSNQATYKPVTVASAGPCELVRELEDGRMLIRVHVERRYTLTEERQALPFIVFEGEEYADRPLDAGARAEAAQLKDKVLTRLLALTADQPAAHEALASPDWQDKDPEAFAFELFGMLQLDGDIMQHILELDSPVDRLQRALEILNGGPAPG